MYDDASSATPTSRIAHLVTRVALAAIAARGEDASSAPLISRIAHLLTRDALAAIAARGSVCDINATEVARTATPTYRIGQLITRGVFPVTGCKLFGYHDD